MNTFMNAMNSQSNFAKTWNGATAHKTTNSAVYDMFSKGGAYRNRSEDDIKLLFKNAYEEDASLALKCLFYLGDCRGGQGERRFFRTAFKWLAQNHSKDAERLIQFIPEYRRWDDILYATQNTPVQRVALNVIRDQLAIDIESKTPSLLAKWLPSENASARQTKILGGLVRNHLKMSHKQYRKVLANLRTRINIVEKLMSENRWDEIEFDKIPSKAGLIYKNAFARRDIIARKYEAFAKSTDTQVNAATLYPYEVVNKVAIGCGYNRSNLGHMSEVDRAMVNKYWENLPDYLEGKDCSIMCVCDTSGSMTSAYGNSTRPIDVAISLGMYCAERLGGPFKDHFITFSNSPKFIRFEGVDFCDKVARVYNHMEVAGTNLIATLELLRKTANRPDVRAEDVPKTLVIISDMQINQGMTLSARQSGISYLYDSYGQEKFDSLLLTEMETERVKWAADGLKMPRIVYWNVNAQSDAAFLDNGPDVTYVSGCSPVIFQSVLTGATGYELMLRILTGARYKDIV